MAAIPTCSFTWTHKGESKVCGKPLARHCTTHLRIPACFGSLAHDESYLRCEYVFQSGSQKGQRCPKKLYGCGYAHSILLAERQKSSDTRPPCRVVPSQDLIKTFFPISSSSHDNRTPAAPSSDNDDEEESGDDDSTSCGTDEDLSTVPSLIPSFQDCLNILNPSAQTGRTSPCLHGEWFCSSCPPSQKDEGKTPLRPRTYGELPEPNKCLYIPDPSTLLACGRSCLPNEWICPDCYPSQKTFLPPRLCGNILGSNRVCGCPCLPGHSFCRNCQVGASSPQKNSKKKGSEPNTCLFVPHRGLHAEKQCSKPCRGEYCSIHKQMMKRRKGKGKEPESPVKQGKRTGSYNETKEIVRRKGKGKEPESPTGSDGSDEETKEIGPYEDY